MSFLCWRLLFAMTAMAAKAADSTEATAGFGLDVRRQAAGATGRPACKKCIQGGNEAGIRRCQEEGLGHRQSGRGESSIMATM